MTMTNYVPKPHRFLRTTQQDVAPPNDWIAKLKEIAASGPLPPPVPRYDGESRLRQKLNAKRRKEVTT